MRTIEFELEHFSLENFFLVWNGWNDDKNKVCVDIQVPYSFALGMLK